MSEAQIHDQMVLFFERQGLFLTERQIRFCRLFLVYQDAVRAARGAGYPDPKMQAQNLYLMYKEYINKWQDHINLDRDLVANNYRRMAQATEQVIDVFGEAHEVPDDSKRLPGCKGLRDLMGMDKNKGIDLNMSGSVELPASLRAKMDKVYDNAQQPDSSE